MRCGTSRSRVAAEVADLHYQSRLDANERRAGTVNNNELLNYRLEAARALHNAEKAATEHERNALVAPLGRQNLWRPKLISRTVR